MRPEPLTSLSQQGCQQAGLSWQLRPGRTWGNQTQSGSPAVNTAASAAPPCGSKMQRALQKGQTGCLLERSSAALLHVPQVEVQGQNYSTPCTWVCLVCACVDRGSWAVESRKGRSEVGISSAGQRRWTRAPFVRTPVVSEVPMGWGWGDDQENRCAAGALCWRTLHPTLLATEIGN